MLLSCFCESSYLPALGRLQKRPGRLREPHSTAHTQLQSPSPAQSPIRTLYGEKPNLESQHTMPALPPTRVEGMNEKLMNSTVETPSAFYVHCRTIHNSQNLETTLVPKNRRLYEETGTFTQ